MKKILYIGCAFLASCSNQATQTNITEAEYTDTLVTVAATPPTWQYENRPNTMTGGKDYYAVIEANELLEFKSPYAGGSVVKLFVRNKEGKTDIMLTISPGQFVFSEPALRAKFDDKLETFSYIASGDGASNVIFVRAAGKFLKRLEKSKTLIIEIGFYTEGKRQITFNIENLDWQHSVAP